MSLIKAKDLPDISKVMLDDVIVFHQSDEYKLLMNLIVDKFPYVRVYTPILTPGVVPAGGTDQTFTITGLSTNDHISLSPPDLSTGLAIGYVRVSATDTLKIRFLNTTAGNLTPASGVYRIKAIRN